MGMYYEGFSEAYENVREMSAKELLEYLDMLFGRDNLPEDYTEEELRREALEQCRREFTDINSREYEMVEFWKKVITADQKRRY